MTKHKIIIYGYNDFTKELIETMDRENFEILVVEPIKAEFIQAKKDGHESLKLFLLDDEELERIEISSNKIQALVVATKDMHNNLFVTLSARALNPTLSIISLSQSEHENKQFYLAGASIVINPTTICGLRIARMISKPRVVEVLDKILFSSCEINLYEYIIQEHSFLEGIFVSDIDFERFGLLLLGLQDRELNDRFIFGAFEQKHRLDANDVLVLLGKEEDFKNFRASLKTLLGDYHAACETSEKPC